MLNTGWHFLFVLMDSYPPRICTKTVKASTSFPPDIIRRKAAIKFIPWQQPIFGQQMLIPLSTLNNDYCPILKFRQLLWSKKYFSCGKVLAKSFVICFSKENSSNSMIHLQICSESFIESLVMSNITFHADHLYFIGGPFNIFFLNTS